MDELTEEQKAKLERLKDKFSGTKEDLNLFINGNNEEPEQIESSEPMEIVRRIYVDKWEDIDFNNLGLHWTSDEEVLIKTRGTLSGNEQAGSKAFNLYVEIESVMINKEATEESNTNHAWEKEVVLKPNTILRNVIVFDMEEGEDVAEIETANSGTRADKWVEGFD